MIYELWDTSTGNLIGSFDTQAEALAMVREEIAKEGPSAFDDVALVEEAEPELVDKTGSSAAVRPDRQVRGEEGLVLSPTPQPSPSGKIWLL